MQSSLNSLVNLKIRICGLILVKKRIDVCMSRVEDQHTIFNTDTDVPKKGLTTVWKGIELKKSMQNKLRA